MVVGGPSRRSKEYFCLGGGKGKGVSSCLGQRVEMVESRVWWVLKKGDE